MNRKRKRAGSTGDQIALGFVEEGEMRVLRQRQLIARLQKHHKSARQAKKELSSSEAILLTLKNHLDITRELVRTQPRRVPKK